MNEIVSVQKEIMELDKLYELHSERMSNVVSEIKFLRRYLEIVHKRHRFKYKGKVYYVVIKPLKRYFSTLQEDKAGNNYIVIKSGLTRQERQRELHIILKNKKCLRWF